MNFDEYQKLAMRTAPRKDKLTLEMHSLHGMTSEVGELHGIYQKILWKNKNARWVF